MFIGGISKKTRGPIGVAVTPCEVRLAQVDARGGCVFATHTLPEQIDPADASFHTATAKAIAHARKGARFAGKRVVSAMPVQSLRYKTLRLPPMPEEDLLQAIAWEAAERLGVDEHDVLQHYAAGRVHLGEEQREEIIVLAARGEAVHGHAHAVLRAGLEPIAIDATGGALARLLGEDDKATLIINIGTHPAEVVVARDRSVVFDKLIALPPASEGGVDEETLARELALCLRYISVTFRINRLDAAWLCGRGADAALARRLGDAVHTPILPAANAPVLADIAFPGGDPSPWLVALGLAVRDETGRARRGAA